MVGWGFLYVPVKSAIVGEIVHGVLCFCVGSVEVCVLDINDRSVLFWSNL